MASANPSLRHPSAPRHIAGPCVPRLLGLASRRPHRAAVSARGVPELGVDAPTAVGAGAAVVGLAGVLIAADPENRRKQQLADFDGDEKESVRNYFNTAGFDRWRRIYGDTGDVNKVQLDIREGHALTIDKVLKWLREEGGVEGETACDAGCGTGSLSIPLALMGATVFASDISDSMVRETEKRYQDVVSGGGVEAPKTTPSFTAQDLESITGKYDTVACLDVMIHYPQDQANDMIRHLASLANKRIILSFAPKTLYYSVLKRVGELFPGPSKATRAYLHSEEDVETALRAAGWKVVKRDMTATNFYFSRLLEAVPA